MFAASAPSRRVDPAGATHSTLPPESALRRHLYLRGKASAPGHACELCTVITVDGIQYNVSCGCVRLMRRQGTFPLPPRTMRAGDRNNITSLYIQQDTLLYLKGMAAAQLEYTKTTTCVLYRWSWLKSLVARLAHCPLEVNESWRDPLSFRMHHSRSKALQGLRPCISPIHPTAAAL